MIYANKTGIPDELLFLGTHGHVIAVSKEDGSKIWSTSLPRTGYSVVSIVPEDGKLLCASGGRVFALDPATGEILWTNHLEGFGRGLVYVATMNSSASQAMATLAAQVEANRSAAT